MAFKESNKNEKKSPIKDKPQRLPGQSLNEEIQKVISEDVEFYAGMFGMYLIVVAVLWINKLTNFFSTYFTLTIFTIAVMFPCAYCIFRLYKSKKHLKNLYQGLDGELYVGQYLTDCLLRKGYNILHDIPVELANKTKFNIDHVIISPNGVYTIETKTISKPVKGKAEIFYDGKNITINGQMPTDEPVREAKGEALWLEDFILKSTGKKIDVRPVIIYPNWYIHSNPSKDEVWILNEKSIASFIDYENVEIEPETVKLITYRLAECCNK